MTNRVQGNRRGAADRERPLTKAEKRALARERAARAAAARRRRKMLKVALAVLTVAALAVGAFLYFRDDGSGSGGGSAEPSAAATGFPPLPAGADPALGTKPTVTAGTGELAELKVTPLVEGTGAAVQAGQRITVNYVGVSYRTGEEFDASWRRSEPFSFQLGQGGVIQGWDQGLAGVRVGSRVQLDIPSNLAYGDNPGGGRPGGPLRFVVDVLGAQ